MEKISSIEQIINDAKQGKMYILVDDEDRENEGDLIIPAQNADASAINFMAKHGRGLICLTLEEQRVKELQLPLMARNNQSRHSTNFTVSIEAKEGITTGISAHDRAKTIADAINPKLGFDDIVSPGHVFPLMAKEGGALVRAGHTEASVDISRLAGKNPSAAICEIMKDDGTMARLPDLLEFAQIHDLNISTIADLIKYRRANDRLVEKIITKNITTPKAGNFEMSVYVNKVEYTEHISLVKGEIDPSKPCLVRVHNHNILSDVIGSPSFGAIDVINKSMQAIEEAGQGVILILRNPKKDALSEFLNFNDDTKSKVKNAQIRNYGIGAQILTDLGVKKMQLLSNSKKQLVGLEGYDLEITGYQEL